MRRINIGYISKEAVNWLREASVCSVISFSVYSGWSNLVRSREVHEIIIINFYFASQQQDARSGLTPSERIMQMWRIRMKRNKYEA